MRGVDVCLSICGMWCLAWRARFVPMRKSAIVMFMGGVNLGGDVDS